MEIGPDMYKTDGDRAVSPVIGVILMVAITVILAAVIAAFVLGIGPGDDPVDAAVDVDGDGTSSIDVSVTASDNADYIVLVDDGGTVYHEDEDNNDCEANTGATCTFDSPEDTVSVYAVLADDPSDLTTLEDADGDLQVASDIEITS